VFDYSYIGDGYLLKVEFTHDFRHCL